MNAEEFVEERVKFWFDELNNSFHRGGWCGYFERFGSEIEDCKRNDMIIFFQNQRKPKYSSNRHLLLNLINENSILIFVKKNSIDEFKSMGRKLEDENFTDECREFFWIDPYAPMFLAQLVYLDVVKRILDLLSSNQTGDEHTNLMSMVNDCETILEKAVKITGVVPVVSVEKEDLMSRDYFHNFFTNGRDLYKISPSGNVKESVLCRNSSNLLKMDVPKSLCTSFQKVMEDALNTKIEWRFSPRIIDIIYLYRVNDVAKNVKTTSRIVFNNSVNKTIVNSENGDEILDFYDDFVFNIGALVKFTDSLSSSLENTMNLFTDTYMSFWSFFHETACTMVHDEGFLAKKIITTMMKKITDELCENDYDGILFSSMFKITEKDLLIEEQIGVLEYVYLKTIAHLGSQYFSFEDLNSAFLYDLKKELLRDNFKFVAMFFMCYMKTNSFDEARKNIEHIVRSWMFSGETLANSFSNNTHISDYLRFDDFAKNFENFVVSYHLVPEAIDKIMEETKDYVRSD